MLFNPNSTKQAIEMCFEHTRNIVSYQPLAFNNNKIRSASSQTHLRLNKHIDGKKNVIKSSEL